MRSYSPSRWAASAVLRRPALGGFLLSLVVLFAPAGGARAATGDAMTSGDAEIQLVVRGPHDVAVGRTLVIDVAALNADPKTVRYRWLLDGRVISSVAEAVMTFDRPGVHQLQVIVTDRLEGRERRVVLVHDIAAYLRKIALIAEASVPWEKLTVYQEDAQRQGIFLAVVAREVGAVPLGEDPWSSLLRQRTSAIVDADAVVVWSEDVVPLNALARVAQEDSSLASSLRSQTILLITQGRLTALRRIAGAAYSVLVPQRILLTRPEAFPLLLSTVSLEEFLVEFSRRDIEGLVLDRSTAVIRPWNLLSNLVNAMITRGVSSQTITLLLMLPVVATIIAFLKQVIGVTTLGLYTPAVIALSLVALGWHVGLLFLGFILIAGYLTRRIVDRFRLLYIPRIAIIMTVVSLTLLLVLALGAQFGVLLAPDTIFVLLIMSTLAERFVNIKAEEGWYSAVTTIGETIAVAIVCAGIVQWGIVRSTVLAYPESVLLLLLVDILLGRWTGLRFRELFRFREVFAHQEE